MQRTNTPQENIKQYRKRISLNAELDLASDCGYPYPTYECEDLYDALNEAKETLKLLSRQVQRARMKSENSKRKYLSQIERTALGALGECHQIFFEVYRQNCYVKKHLIEVQMKAKVAKKTSGGAAKGFSRIKRAIDNVRRAQVIKPTVRGHTTYNYDVLHENIVAVAASFAKLMNYAQDIDDADTCDEDLVQSHELSLIFLQGWECGLSEVIERLYQLIFEIRAQRGRFP